MSIEGRRATIQKLIIGEVVAGARIENDADFMSLADRWINHEIDMPELCRRYRTVREQRRSAKWKLQPDPEVEPRLSVPPSSPEEFLAEIARMKRSDFSD